MFGEKLEFDEKTLGIMEQIGKHMPGGFFIYEARQPEKLLYANHAVLDIFGCENLEEFKTLTGYTFKGMLHPDDYAAISDSIVEQIDKNDNNMDYVEYRIIRKDGSVRWVDDFGHFTETQRYGGIYYVFISDITEKRERMETDKAVRQAVIEALSESYHTVWLINDVETGNFSLYRGDVEGSTVHAAPIKDALTQMKYPQAKEYYISSMVAPEDQKRLGDELTLQNIAKRLSEKPQFSITYLRRLNDGSKRYFRIEFAKVDMPGGKLGVVCGFKDVDDEVRGEQAIQKTLREALQAAEEASRAKTNFLSNMSHEIRTPITAILGMNELIRRESTDKNVLEYSGNIDKAGTSLLGIINDILDFSKIEAGRMELINVDYRLSDLVVDLLNLTRFRAEEKGLILKTVIDPALPSVLNGDELRVKQIITNLLSNAVKYTEKGTVTLSMKAVKWDKEAVDIAISVTDTGIGIRAEEQDKLFLEFDRLDVIRTRSIEGTGLGLAITSKMLELMDSSLQVESIYGSGSTFCFTIKQQIVDGSGVGEIDPLAVAGKVADHKEDSTYFVAPDARVLIVDDTPLNLQVISGLLKRTRVQIDTASSGRECIEQFGTDVYYDMVFLDYRMPQMDGIETLSKLHELYPEKASSTPIICLTASAVTGDREKMLSAGFNDYLSKPVNIAKMEDMMRRYLSEDRIEIIASEDTKEDDEQALLPKEIFEIDELNPAAGLDYCGDTEDYMAALEVYKDSVQTKAQDITDALERGDLDTYVTMVHSLKSTSKAIGAKELSELALELEQAGRGGDENLIKEKTPEFIARYQRLGELLCKKVFY